MPKHSARRTWYQFEREVLAVNEQAALYLLAFLRQAQRQELHISTIEVFDLHRYKLIKEPRFVRNILHMRSHDLVFIFPVCKN